MGGFVQGGLSGRVGGRVSGYDEHPRLPGDLGEGGQFVVLREGIGRRRRRKLDAIARERGRGGRQPDDEVVGPRLELHVLFIDHRAVAQHAQRGRGGRRALGGDLQPERLPLADARRGGHVADDDLVGGGRARQVDGVDRYARRGGQPGGLGRVARRRRAVAQHHDAPGGVGRQEGQAQPQRLGQIGVEAAGLRGEGGQVVGRVEAAQRLLDQGVGPEEDDPGAVVRPHRADSLAHERLGRRGALAAHRVGAVDQKDHSQIIHRPRQLRPGQAQDEQGQDEQSQDQPHPAGARPRPWPAASRPRRPDPPGHQRQRREQQ